MNKNVKMGLFIVGSLSVPYLYYIFLRPKLMQLEGKFDQKVTSISDKDFEKMKMKMEEIKRNKNNGEQNH